MRSSIRKTAVWGQGGFYSFKICKCKRGYLSLELEKTASSFCPTLLISTALNVNSLFFGSGKISWEEDVGYTEEKTYLASLIKKQGGFCCIRRAQLLSAKVCLCRACCRIRVRGRT